MKYCDATWLGGVIVMRRRALSSKSDAVTGVPSDQLAARSLNVQVRPSRLVVQLSAMPGTIAPLASRMVRPMNRPLIMRFSQLLVALAGSNVSGSAPLPIDSVKALSREPLPPQPETTTSMLASKIGISFISRALFGKYRRATAKIT